MYKLAVFLFLTSFIAIAISRKVRLAPKYERTSSKPLSRKSNPHLDPWKAMDQGIDPTDGRETEGNR
jgi:hypothetical protein